MKRSLFRRVIAALLLATLAVPGAAPTTTLAAPPPLSADAVRTFFDGYMPPQMLEKHIAGAAVVVVQNGEIIVSRGYGLANVAQSTPVDPETTLFRIGSNTKTFIGTAVMQLVARGKLDLHTDVNQYLKDFQIPAAFGQPITLEHLLTHTAGFEELNRGLFAATAQDQTPLGSYLTQNMPQRVYPPGTVTAYSNYGMALAGYIVERVTGEPLEQYLQRQIFDPLRMTHTSYAQPPPAALAAQSAAGHVWSNGTFRVLPVEIVNAAPAGAISASASDMGRFMIAQLHLGQGQNAQILDEAAAKEMQRLHFANDPRVGNGWGLSFMRLTTNGVAVFGHGGDTQNFHSALLMLPDRDLGVYIVNNTQGGGSFSLNAYAAFMNQFYPPQPFAQPASPEAAQRAQAYVGDYASTRRNYSTIEKLLGLGGPTVTRNDDGTLSVDTLLDATNQPRRWAEVEAGLYRDVAGTGQIAFQERQGLGMVLSTTFPTAVYVRVPWYQGFTLQQMLLVGPPLLFVLTLLVLGIAALVRRVRRRPADAAETSVRRQLAIVAALNVLFIVGLVTLLAVNPEYLVVFRRSFALIAVLALGVAAALGDLWLVVVAGRAWARQTGSLFGRLGTLLVAIAGVLFVTTLAQLNLIGWFL